MTKQKVLSSNVPATPLFFGSLGIGSKPPIESISYSHGRVHVRWRVSEQAFTGHPFKKRILWDELCRPYTQETELRTLIYCTQNGEPTSSLCAKPFTMVK